MINSYAQNKILGCASSVSVRQIQNLDKAAIERYGIPSLVLMENAGRAVAEEVKNSLRGEKNR